MRLSESSKYRTFGIAYGMGNLQAAIEALEDCLADEDLADSPERRSFLTRELARVLFEAGRLAEGRGRLREAEIEDRDSFLNQYYLGSVYLQNLDDASEALRRVDRSIELIAAEERENTNSRRWGLMARALRGRCLAALGQISDAATELAVLRESGESKVVDHVVELCEELLQRGAHRGLAAEHLRELADDLRITGEIERIAIADRIDAILAMRKT